MKEECQCGHQKECHLAHTLDKHGGMCEHCDCTCYTWMSFLWNDKEMKARGNKK